MASTDKPAIPPKPDEAPPPPPPPATSPVNWFVIDVVLRVLLFAATLVALIVLVTSKQTELAPRGAPGGTGPKTVKFNHSPALIYFVAALSVACLYSIITTLASISVILKPAFSKEFLLHFALMDALVLGVLASATGAAGSIVYTQKKGNEHAGWDKVCPGYDKFCDHMISSVFVSLLASIILVLLIFLSIFSLHKRARD